jgi:oligoribonuclease NrnB/cAMP/cGMP phosphodiesterase (DHH superfamily)
MILNNMDISSLMSNKLYKVFTHGDLDGAVSLLSFFWTKPESTIEYEELFNNTVEDRLMLYKEKTLNKPTTLIMDFSIRESFLNFDSPEFVFIDHHKNSEQFVNKFSKSKIIFKDTTSNTALMYNTFLKDNISLTKEQKYLIALANDFDCYELKLKDSYDLNVLFWSEYRGKFSKFIDDYYFGFKPFTENQRKIIENEKYLGCKLAETYQKFSGELKIKNQPYKTLAVIGEKYNLLANDCLINKYNPDIFFFINIKTEKVNMRKNPAIKTFEIGKFAEKICDGGGNSNSAGGHLTPVFMEMMKNLKPE